MNRFEGVEYGTKEYRRLASKEWREKHPEEARQQKRNWRRKNPEKNRLTAQVSRHKNIIPYMLIAARSRAKEKGIEFNIASEDIILPTYCPILGYKLVKNTTKQPNSPSLDRVDNTKGYIKGNVRVISSRANTLKNDGTVEEFFNIIKYMKEHRLAH